MYYFLKNSFLNFILFIQMIFDFKYCEIAASVIPRYFATSFCFKLYSLINISLVSLLLPFSFFVNIDF